MVTVLLFAVVFLLLSPAVVYQQQIVYIEPVDEDEPEDKDDE